MAITFHCAGCGKSYSVPEGHAGRQVLCPGCNAVIEIPAPPAPPSPAPPPLPGAPENLPPSLPPAPGSPASPPAPVPAPQTFDFSVPLAAGPTAAEHAPLVPAESPPPAPTDAAPAGPASPAAPHIHVTVHMATPPAPHPEARAQPRPPPVARPSTGREASPSHIPVPDNGPLLACCVVLLAAIGVPWSITGEQPVWSWEVLPEMPGSLVTFVIGEWILAGVLLLLGMMMSGTAFSLVVTALSSVGLVLMAGAGDDLGQWPDLGAMLSQAAEARTPVVGAAVLAAMALYVAGSVRARISPSIVASVLEGVAGIACAVLMSLVFWACLRTFLAGVRESSLLNAVSSPAALLGAAVIAAGFAALAGFLAAADACGLTRPASGSTQSALALLRTALAILAVAFVAIAGVAAGTPVGSLKAGIAAVLFLGMPLLLLCAVTRLAGNLLAALRRIAGV